MRQVDVAIAGGGLAGATAAAMLARAGLEVAVVDPHPVYPFDFRSEKLAGPQVHLLRRTGLADAVLAAATPIDDLWIARFGRLVERRRNQGEITTAFSTIRWSTPFARRCLRPHSWPGR
jgi:2-polyprenyl-6-methoxyphenol hydroxylase-like FAD-dependent oxidoreductase